MGIRLGVSPALLTQIMFTESRQKARNVFDPRKRLGSGKQLLNKCPIWLGVARLACGVGLGLGLASACCPWRWLSLAGLHRAAHPWRIRGPRRTFGCYQPAKGSECSASVCFPPLGRIGSESW